MRLILIFFLFLSGSIFSQNSLEDIIGSTKDKTQPITSIFSSTRLINGHTVEMIPKGVAEFRISHRFGTIEEGFYDIFGLDKAQIRLGYDYGISKNVMIGFGRSSYKKTYDIFSRVSFMNQSTDNKIPLSLQYLFASSIETLRYGNKIPFMQRLGIINKILVAKKIGKLSIQVSPTLMIHEFYNYRKKVFSSLGFSARYMLGNRVALTTEYHYRLKHDDDLTPAYQDVFERNYNSFGIGIDIETGGHIFQFHFSNSSAMNEKGFIFETDKSWSDGQICFGFNILREFSSEKKSKEW
tara:strand:- start:1275 stop:2162 length:888 start_codon:yes stop_codon:yes gene_type:complete